MAYQIQVVPKKKRRMMQQGLTRKTLSGRRVMEGCITCPFEKECVFCDFPKPMFAEFDKISSPSSFPKDAILFVEGQEPRGVYVICSGRVKLSTSSSDGKSIIVRVADVGEVVGLPGMS